MTLNLSEHPVGPDQTSLPNAYPGEDRCLLMVQATYAAAEAMGWAKLIWYATDPADQERAVGKLREAHAALGDALATFDATPQPSAAPLKPMVIPENLRRGMPDPPDGENGGKHDWQRGSKCYRITPAGRSALDGGAR